MARSPRSEGRVVGRGTNSISRFEFVCAFECLCFSVVFHVRDSVETVAAAPIA